MQPSSGLNRSDIKMNALDSESGGKGLTGKTSDEEKNGRKSFQHNFSGQLEEEMEESEWEDGSIPILNSSSDNRGKNLIIEFDGSSKSASRKPIRRASAQEKELAELAHKVHLLCLIARGRLIDEACDDPLIQASLLSLLPVNFLNISELSNLTVRALAPLVHWFHSNFRTRSPRDEERSFHSALAFALESREGTAEEIAALSVALFRALNLTTRFVSILDVASLKPDSRFESPDQDASRAGKGIFKSSTIMVDSQSEVSVSPVRSSSSADKENICQNSIRVASKDSSSTRKNAFSKEFRVDDELAQRASDSIVCEAQSSASEACDTKKSANPKRKGDLEFEMQMEMAFSATAVGVQENSMDSDVNDLHINSSELSFPIKRMKRVKCGESKISSPGISTAVGSRKVGAPLYWAEVYCSGENLTGKWVHCDAVNAIIDGEREVEAEAAACKKSLRYVVAFAGHGAKDVTRRYCMQWYKVASQRVNSVWWDAVLAPLKELESGATGGIVYLGDQRINASNDGDKGEALTVSGCPTQKNSPDLLNGPGSLTVDHGKTIDSESSVRNSSVATRRSLEDMELETRALTEPLPTNQQAYKNHQLYAIEKWLTKYQMLHPKGPILGFCSGHPVYPQACVQTLKTKNRWLREGLQIKANELPSKVLKRSTKLSKSDESGHPDYVEGDFEANISLYGKWQTEPLCLPRAANGIVPKNERGQVDVWSEKCLPPGTVHLRLARVVPVAKRLEVDFAPAMVGFEFRNGRSLPVYDGIVVCAEVKDAILEAYAEEEERREAEEKKRNEIQAISRWYQLLSSIITRQRLNDCYNGPVSSQISTDTAIADQEHVGSGDGDVGKGHSLVSQQEFARDTKLDTPSTLARGNHEHIFLTEDQIHDEDSLVLTKRCRCGFSVQVEQL